MFHRTFNHPNLLPSFGTIMISILSRYLECLMHCINGIIIQLPNSPSDLYQSLPDSTPVRRSKPKSRNRKRSFQAIYNDLEPYYIKKRENPRPITSTVSPYQKNYLQESWKIDLTLTILCFRHVTTGNSIPNWTDFNYLFDEKEANDSCHTIGYLPEIDQSTTSFEVVAEVLGQSKVKAEALRLTEVDVVMDQAIYAKAVEIMLHPTHAD